MCEVKWEGTVMFELQNLSICCVLSPLRINSKGGRVCIPDTKHAEVCGVQKRRDMPRKTGGWETAEG